MRVWEMDTGPMSQGGGRAGPGKSNALDKILNCTPKHTNHSYAKVHQIFFYGRSKKEERMYF